MTGILTVLRRGGEYTDEHVERLRAQCDGYPFECIDDAELLHGWPGWWSKIELFRRPGPVLYMDLDTLVHGSLDPLLEAAEKHEFIALRDFNRLDRLGSGLMAWRGDMSRLYEKFKLDPQKHMIDGRRFGDQGYIDVQVPLRTHWQDILPGKVVSWKKHCRHTGIPQEAAVVCFHGRPRPWEVGL